MVAYKDLREFIALLEKQGELVRISTPVDPELEITEITDRVSKRGGPALLFENVKGSEYPVLINTFGSYHRMAQALGVERLSDIGDEILQFFDTSTYSGFVNQVKVAPKLLQLAGIFPKRVKKAPCQEVIEHNPDLTKRPVLKCWPQDGGRFITLPLVVTRNPQTGQCNLGMYRMQVYDAKTTGMHWHLHKDGRENCIDGTTETDRIPVSVALGGDQLPSMPLLHRCPETSASTCLLDSCGKRVSK